MPHTTATPIIDMLKRYNSEGNTRFHMPGHKGKSALEVCKEFEGILPYDVTEVAGTDNLHFPTEAISEARKLLAEAYGARESFFLVNGSTCGIFIALSALFKRDDSVIIIKSCHTSVHNAVEFLGLKTIEVDDVKQIRDVAQNNSCSGVVLTRPNYYGECLDIQIISRICREQGLLLVTDEAHGAHLNFAQREYPKSAVKYSDITVQSAHKTIGALNQSAFLHVNNRGCDFLDEIKHGSRIFQTSSPSYIILASADCARAYMQEKGAELLEKLLVNIERTIEKIELDTPFKVERRKMRGLSQTPDRLVINTMTAGLIGYSVEKYLRSRAIQVEMADEERVVCLCSVFDDDEDFERLVNALIELVDHAAELKDVQKDIENELGRKKILDELQGLIDKHIKYNVIQFPPGVVLVEKGVILTRSIYNKIERICLAGGNIFCAQESIRELKRRNESLEQEDS